MSPRASSAVVLPLSGGQPEVRAYGSFAIIYIFLLKQYAFACFEFPRTLSYQMYPLPSAPYALTRGCCVVVTLHSFSLPCDSPQVTSPFSDHSCPSLLLPKACSEHPGTSALGPRVSLSRVCALGHSKPRSPRSDLASSRLLLGYCYLVPTSLSQECILDF